MVNAKDHEDPGRTSTRYQERNDGAEPQRKHNNMNKIDKFILGAVLVGILVNLSAIHLDRQYTPIAGWAALAIGVALGLYALYRLIDTALNYFRYGRYAILIFFLNNMNDLLLIRHPFHKCYLPPGGRLQQLELPHKAIARKLKEEAGIESFELHPKFHNPRLVISEIVEDVPRPYTVHMEHRRQRGFVRFHYAFVYVCKFDGQDEQLPHVPGYEPHFYDLRTIRDMRRGTIPYDDIIRRYEDILSRLDAPHDVDQR